MLHRRLGKPSLGQTLPACTLCSATVGVCAGPRRAWVLLHQLAQTLTASSNAASLSASNPRNCRLPVMAYVCFAVRTRGRYWDDPAGLHSLRALRKDLSIGQGLAQSRHSLGSDGGWTKAPICRYAKRNQAAVHEDERVGTGPRLIADAYRTSPISQFRTLGCPPKL